MQYKMGVKIPRPRPVVHQHYLEHFGAIGNIHRFFLAGLKLRLKIKNRHQNIIYYMKKKIYIFFSVTLRLIKRFKYSKTLRKKKKILHFFTIISMASFNPKHRARKCLQINFFCFLIQIKFNCILGSP